MPEEFTNPLNSLKKSRFDINSFPSTSTNPPIITYHFLDSQLYASKECGGRGNCLFLSISYQLPKSSENNHHSLRQRAVSYIEDNLEEFAPSLRGLINPKNQKPYSPKMYIEEKRNDGEYGDEPEIRALSQVLNRTIRIYEPHYLNKSFDGFSFKIEYTSIGK